MADLTQRFQNECNVGDLVEVWFRSQDIPGSNGRGIECHACGFVGSLYLIFLNSFYPGSEDEKRSERPESFRHIGFSVGPISRYKKV